MERNISGTQGRFKQKNVTRLKSGRKNSTEIVKERKLRYTGYISRREEKED